MDLKFKFGDFKLKYDNIDMGNIVKACEKIPQMMFDYCNDMGRAYERLISLARTRSVDFDGRDDIFPANGHDTYNYIARYGIGNFHGQAVLKLDSILDFDRLSEAVRLSVQQETIFGCRYVENDPPYWRRIKNLDELNFCYLEQAEDEGIAVKRFLESPLDMDNDPNIKVKVVRTAQGDTVCFKINHACSDGAGIKEYIMLISDIYSKIVRKDGSFTPVPKKRSRADQDRLLNTLGIEDPDSAFIPGSDISAPTWAFPWKHGSSKKTCMEVCRINPEQLGKITAFAHSKGATVNDLILTAYHRAMLSVKPQKYGMPVEIPITVDLRRYLPDKKTEGIRNFSGSVNTRLALIENETFEGTLSRVIPVMNEIKNGTPGVQSALGLERLEKTSFKNILSYYQVTKQYLQKSSECIPYHGEKCIPTLSNLGILSRSLIKFGDNTVTDAYIIPPVVRPPGFLLMACSYNGIMTLAGGFYEATARREDIRGLILGIKGELVENCCKSHPEEWDVGAAQYESEVTADKYEPEVTKDEPEVTADKYGPDAGTGSNYPDSSTDWDEFRLDF